MGALLCLARWETGKEFTPRGICKATERWRRGSDARVKRNGKNAREETLAEDGECLEVRIKKQSSGCASSWLGLACGGAQAPLIFVDLELDAGDSQEGSSGASHKKNLY